MPELSVTIVDRQGDTFGRAMDRRIAKLLDAEKRAGQAAAKKATQATRANVKHSRQIIPPRPGRSSTGGRMAEHLSWRYRQGGVEFDVASADRGAPHWIIQNLGTGKRARMRVGGADVPRGRPRKGDTSIRTVKSQKGRRISGGLVFATGGKYSPPGARRDEQLHWASQVMGVPMRTKANPRGQAAAIRIRNEIQGQRFVQRGAEQGFREYRTSVLAAARQAFRKSLKP